MTASNIMVAILIIIALVMMIAISAGFLQKLEAATIHDQCKTDVYKNAMSKVGKIKFLKNIKCETEYVTVTEKAPILIKKAVADQMLKCWDKFWYGTLDLFEEDGTYCHICSRLTFENKQQIKGLTQYLLSAKAKKGKTYGEIMLPTMTGKAEALGELEKPTNQDKIDTNKDQAITFLYIRGKDNLEHYMKIIPGYGTGAGLITIGTTLMTTGFAAAPIPFIGWTAGTGTIIAGGLTTLAGIGMEAYTYLWGGAEQQRAAFIQLTEYNPEALDSLGCTRPVSTE